MTDIPYGYCHCGCGQKTKVVTRNIAERGLKKGEPSRFVLGHNSNGQKLPTKSLAERLWSRVAITANPDKCWEWQAGLNRGGYGRIRRTNRGKQVGTHRIAYELIYGEIPNGLWVLHKCDNPKCCNPAHLFLGTAAHNSADRNIKGRQSRGEKHAINRRGEKNGQHKLTAEKVRYIRERYSQGIANSRELAEEMGVTQSTIVGILNRRSWKHI